MENGEIIEVNSANIEKEDICCALGGNPEAVAATQAKKQWMRQNFEAGYRFWRLNRRGKALIEGTPGQNAWAPVEADNWFFIDCFWVSGKFKGQGVAKRLLQTAKEHARAQGMHGLVALASKRKRGFLSDAGFYHHMGFETADTAPPDFVLLALPFAKNNAMPRFNKSTEIEPENKGIFISYSHHCPHTERYVEVLREKAGQMKVPFTAQLLETAAQAKQAPSPFTTWAMFYNGAFVTNEIYSENKLVKFLETAENKA